MGKQEKSLQKEKKRKLKNETLGNFYDLSIWYAHRRSRTTRISRSSRLAGTDIYIFSRIFEWGLRKIAASFLAYSYIVKTFFIKVPIILKIFNSSFCVSP